MFFPSKLQRRHLDPRFSDRFSSLATYVGSLKALDLDVIDNYMGLPTPTSTMGEATATRPSIGTDVGRRIDLARPPVTSFGFAGKRDDGSRRRVTSPISIGSGTALDSHQSIPKQTQRSTGFRIVKDSFPAGSNAIERGAEKAPTPNADHTESKTEASPKHTSVPSTLSHRSPRHRSLLGKDLAFLRVRSPSLHDAGPDQPSPRASVVMNLHEQDEVRSYFLNVCTFLFFYIYRGRETYRVMNPCFLCSERRTWLADSRFR